MDLTEEYLQQLEAVDPIQMAQLGIAGIISGSGKFEDAQKLLEQFCDEEHKDDPIRLERCKSLRYTPSGLDYTSEEIDIMTKLAVGGGAAAGVIATALIAWAHKKYMDIYGKANQACGKMKGTEGKLCRQNYKVQAAKAEIQALKFARSKCRRSKDPKACVQQLNEKVKDLMDKYPDIEYTMKALSKHKQESYNLVEEIEDILNGNESGKNVV